MSFLDGLSAPRYACSLGFLFLSLTPASSRSQNFDSTGLFDPSKAALTTVPGSIRQVSGKYPASIPLIIVRKDCTATTGNFAPTGAGGSVYTITAAGAGLSITDPVTAAGCQLTARLTIDPTLVQPGYILLSVVELPPASGTTPAKDVATGNAVLTFMNAAAGPIPGYPQVDVIWGVMSQHFCKDNFGRHVASDLYCIQVEIGNNTGYPLQIAGIGFRPPVIEKNTVNAQDEVVRYGSPRQNAMPNASYLSVRSSAQAFQFWNAHNLTNSVPQATGLIMAAFNPFFHAAYSIARWTAGAAIIGTAIPGAGALVAPDVTIKQLNNLDDQALRDGKLIPNNTQIRTQVFVERESIKGRPAYLAACHAIYPNDSDKVAEQTCEKSNNDVIAVKRALGDLIVVGDEISFIQRLVVDPNVSSQEVSPGSSSAVTRKATISELAGVRTLSLPATSASIAKSFSLVVNQSKYDIPSFSFDPATGAIMYSIPQSIEIPIDAKVSVEGVGSDGKPIEAIPVMVPAPQTSAEPVKPPQTPPTPKHK